MRPGQQIVFLGFRLDLGNQCLWREEQAVPLTPKAFALLQYLAQPPGQLVTKAELLEAVWPETFITDAVLKVRIGEVRRALGDEVKTPRSIETAQRRGLSLHRKNHDGGGGRPRRSVCVSVARRPCSRVGAPGASAGPGVGRVMVARGQCLEQYGASEAYLPWLDACTHLAATVRASLDCSAGTRPRGWRGPRRSLPKKSVSPCSAKSPGWDATCETADAAVVLATDQGFPLWLPYGTILRGWARAKQGEIDAGIRDMQRGLEAMEAINAQTLRPYCLSLLAEIYVQAGQIREGLATVAQALAVVATTDERFWEAELHRVKGELLLASHDDPRDVEQAFQKAIDVSRKQNAKSLELRATMSLCRVWQGQARQREAHALLAGIYGWFTEGFDTADLTDAKALLAKLDSGE